MNNVTLNLTTQAVEAIIQLLATQDFQIRTQLITEIQKQVKAQSEQEVPSAEVMN
jgi:hypothetical protein